ncbi:MAG: ABC transporter substrate-binding protein [Betaproteobacteria bacterium]|nr:MAG: ABC transporter substrate-binding protein [Betaproteobacteria bacterium]
MKRSRLIGFLLTVGLALGFGSGAANAEVKEVRIAEQFGIGYLPLQMMRDRSLLEKHAKKLGLGDIKVTWSRFSGGRAMNDALLSGNLDFASGGVGPLLTIWDKTKGNLEVKGVAAINSMPLYLNTNNPNVKSLKDFTEKDKIALPAVKVSVQARTLQMAAEKEFGPGKHEALDRFTVSMKHPDGVAAMLSGRSEITGHLTSPPYQQRELQDSKVRRILSSYDVLGGKSTFNAIWTSSKFRVENPKTYQAFVSALKEAMELINANKSAASDVFMKQTKSKLDPEFVRKIVLDPENEFTVTPRNTMKYAEFMHKVGALKTKASSWKDYFFPEIHDLSGS